MFRERSVLPLSLAVALGLSVLVVFLWSGGGFAKVGLIEEWHIWWWRSTGGSLIPHPGAAQRVRMLARVPHEVAWTITPGLFVGLNLVHATLFLLKGLFAYMLVREVAPSRLRLAVLAGALFVVWPADTGLFATRAVTQHFSIAALILGAVLLVRFARTGSMLTAAGMTAAAGAATLSHEVTLPLALVMPVLIAGQTPGGRRVWLRLLLWYPLPLLAAGRLAFELTVGTGSYQREKLSPPGLVEIAASLERSAGALFVSPWLDFWHLVTWPYLAAAAAAALPVVLLATFAGRGRPDPAPGEPGPIRVAATGLVIIAAGLVPHLATGMRGTRYTTLFLSSLGAAICLALGSDVLAGRRRRGLFAAAALILISVSLVVGRAQHAEYIQWSRLQQRLLLDIARVSGGGFAPGTLVLLIGEAPGFPPPGWLFDERYPFHPPIAFRDGLRYALDDGRILARLCYPNHPARHASIWWSHHCELGPRSVRVRTGAQRAVEAPYDHVVAFEYDAAAQRVALVRQIRPRWLIDPVPAVAGYAPERRFRASPQGLSRAERILLDPAPSRDVQLGAPGLDAGTAPAR